MAWKLKKSKATVDELPQTDDESPNEPVSPSQFDRPASTGGHDSDHPDFGGNERTVILLNDSSYIPGLIPSSPQGRDGERSPTGESDLFPAASDEDLDRYLRGESSFDPDRLSDEQAGGIDIDATHVEAPLATSDMDEPNLARARIDLDDEPVHSAPIDLDDLPASSAIVDLDDLPAAAHADIGSLPSASRETGVGDLPGGSIYSDFAVTPKPPAGIDIDDASAHLSPDIDMGAAISPSVPSQPVNGSKAAHRPIDAPDEDSDFYASALNASDAAVASFRSAADEEPPQAAVDSEPAPQAHSAAAGSVGSAPMENWDLDAFAPYQPPGGAVATPAAETSATGSVGAVPADETLAGAAAVSRLIVRLGQFSASYELTKAETTIGRPDPRTSVFPDVAVEWDDAVSRNHCRVLHKDDGDYVEDTGSTNGTRLNDKGIKAYQPVLLTDGDRIGVGEKTEISYLK